jgi:Domain of unknown function (DUF5710)
MAWQDQQPVDIRRIAQNIELTDDYYDYYRLERPTRKAVSQGDVNQSDSMHKTWLEVPFGEKEDAKVLGARWDSKEKKWYKIGSTKGLEQWLPGAKKKKKQGYVLGDTRRVTQWLTKRKNTQ